jgi:hypothetical protein
MKHYISRLPSAFFLLFALSASAKETELKTTITNVTVFQSGAQVYRIGEVTIPAGEHEIIIDDATPLLKKESIQVKGEGNFTILSVDHRMETYDVDNEKTKWPELEAKQKDLMRQMEELSVKIQVLNAQLKTIEDLQNTRTTTKGVTVDQISNAQETVRIKMTAIKNEKLKLSRQVLDLFDEHKVVTQHLVALKTPKQNVRYEIVIKVVAKAETKGKFQVNYIVPNASWFPTYDLRVKSISDPMTIEYKANITQESGEDWNNVSLKLSTGDPSQSSERPQLNSWKLSLNQNYEQPHTYSDFYDDKKKHLFHVKGLIVDSKTGAAIPWCSVMLPGGMIGTVGDAEGRFSLVLPEENAAQLYVYCVGYTPGALTIFQENNTIALQKLDMPLNGTVKTDYEKQLMTLQSPVFNDDYEGDLLTLDVPVNPQYESDGIVNTSYGYSMNKIDELKKISDYNMMDKIMSEKEMYKTSITKDLGVNRTLNIVSTEFTIEEKYTILSEPKNIAVPVQTIQANASYQYYCAPRYDKDVFLTAQLVNWEQYNLLEGQANVFFEGTFIGNTYFDTRYLVDTLEVSLGRDKSIKVERVKSKEYEKYQVLGNDNITSRQWDISVRNTKQQPINIVVEDQFPVSADSKITVTQEEKSNGSLNDKTAVVTWTMKLDPSVTQKMQLRYKVKYPKDDFVGIE